MPKTSYYYIGRARKVLKPAFSDDREERGGRLTEEESEETLKPHLTSDEIKVCIYIGHATMLFQLAIM